MTYNTDLLEHNLHNIMECLQASTSTVRHLVLGHPQLLLLNRVTLAARVSDLKVCSDVSVMLLLLLQQQHGLQWVHIQWLPLRHTDLLYL